MRVRWIMKTEYLKKTRFLKLAKMLNDDLDNVKTSVVHYKFHRGTEWLKIFTNDFYYCFTRLGCNILIHQYIFDADLERHEVSYRVFNININQFVNSGILVVNDKYLRS